MTIETSRRRVLALLGTGTLGVLVFSYGHANVTPTAMGNGVITHVSLRVSDAQGGALSLEALRRIQSSGRGEVGYDDALLDAETLEVIAVGPLHQDESGAIGIDVPIGRECTLTLSWPTSYGYSAFVADLSAFEEHDLLELAARALHGRQAECLAQVIVRGFKGADEAEKLRASAQQSLNVCVKVQSWTERGRLANSVLESAAGAQLSLGRTLSAQAPQDAVIGVTFTRVPTSAEIAAALAPSGPGDGGREVSARLVIGDPNDAEEMTGWRNTMETLHAQGGQALVQACDSHDLVALTDSAWDTQVDTLIKALPSVDAWEIGNEIGGDWLGTGPVAGAQRTAKTARECTSAMVVLTLYYQLGQADPTYSLLSYAARELPASIRELIGIVGLPVHSQLHPFGTAVNRVLNTPEAVFSSSRIIVTEFRHGGADLDAGPWWFGSTSDPVAAHTAVAEYVTGAALGRSDVWGVPFRQYYPEDQVGTPGGQVAPALAAASMGFQDAGAGGCCLFRRCPPAPTSVPARRGGPPSPPPRVGGKRSS